MVYNPSPPQHPGDRNVSEDHHSDRDDLSAFFYEFSGSGSNNADSAQHSNDAPAARASFHSGASMSGMNHTQRGAAISCRQDEPMLLCTSPSSSSSAFRQLGESMFSRVGTNSAPPPSSAFRQLGGSMFSRVGTSSAPPSSSSSAFRQLGESMFSRVGTSSAPPSSSSSAFRQLGESMFSRVGTSSAPPSSSSSDSRQSDESGILRVYMNSAAQSSSSRNRSIPALNMIAILDRFQELDDNGVLSSSRDYMSANELLGLIVSEALETMEERYRMPAREALCEYLSTLLALSLQK